MTSPYLILGLLASIAFSLATQLCVWRESSAHQRSEAGSVLEVLMGDSRRLFANHFITKADVYLHSGVYPSIFDQAQRARGMHLSAAASSAQGQSKSPSGQSMAMDDASAHHEDVEHDEHDAVTGLMQKPRDWIDAFGRNFYPTKHVHLETAQQQRELLPWLQLAAELNPNDVDVYTIGAYWLRQRMGRAREAEQFLRQGWRANPESYDILFELARLQEESYRDDTRARNLYQLALRKWDASEPTKGKPDELTLMQILGHLARIEERVNRIDEAIGYLERLREISPAPESVRQQIAALRARQQIAAHRPNSLSSIQ
jgi:tetratricopeptide (TPR) repeat protein